MIEKALCSLYSYTQKAVYYSSSCYMAVPTKGLIVKIMLISPLMNFFRHS